MSSVLEIETRPSPVELVTVLSFSFRILKMGISDPPHTVGVNIWDAVGERSACTFSLTRTDSLHVRLGPPQTKC